MSFYQYLKGYRILGSFAAVGFGIFISAPSLLANVYATNIRANGETNAVVAPGDSITVTYRLNEPASMGITVKILSGATAVRTFTFAGNSPGTDRGLNSIVWDGTDAQSNAVPLGSYSVSITAGTSGYTNWTQITSDSADGNTYVWEGNGIAVDRNPSSPFYGRVFVANSDFGPNPAANPGDEIGILKFNADTSAADEGIASEGSDGHEWSGGNVSPWKVETSDDDYVYVSDLARHGEVYRWDPLISSNSLLYVLRQDNQPAGAALTGPAMLGAGTNTQILMADTHGTDPLGLRVLRWIASTNGACVTNDQGTTIIGLGTNLSGPLDVALDKSGNVYVCQFVTTATNVPIVFRFPATTNGAPPASQPDWAVGTNDATYGRASGIAVDPTGTYVAVSFQGSDSSDVLVGITNGNTRILYATNGMEAVNLNLGVDIEGINDATHQDTDCAWDAVGNVYYIDTWVGHWRAVSPPGTNQSTSLASALILVQSTNLPPPTLTGIAVSNGIVMIDFTGDPSDSASAFALVGAAVVTGPYLVQTNATIVQLSAGVFRATVLASGPMRFYNVQRQNSPPLPGELRITRIALSGGTVTIGFTGSSSDVATLFTLVSAASPAGAYTATAGAQISQISSGVFQATAPATAPIQFYRIQR